jgi:hypothetical protein
MAAAETRRGDETDAVKRIYPGGAFDPLNFAKGDIESLKLKEIKNGRLAMMACLGFVAQHAATGKTPLQALGDHLSNPWANTVSWGGSWGPGGGSVVGGVCGPVRHSAAQCFRNFSCTGMYVGWRRAGGPVWAACSTKCIVCDVSWHCACSIRLDW